MAQALRLAMPGPGEDLRSWFEARVQAGQLDAALDLSVVEFDELAQLAAVTVTGVEQTQSGVALNYQVVWTSFHACDDRHFGGQHARTLRGRADQGDWLFEPHQPWPTHRDASDEL